MNTMHGSAKGLEFLVQRRVARHPRFHNGFSAWVSEVVEAVKRCDLAGPRIEVEDLAEHVEHGLPESYSRAPLSCDRKPRSLHLVLSTARVDPTS
jgi:hypothetical protein